MTKRNLRFFASVALAVGLACSSLAAQDFGDDFEDGVLGVNNSANGTGFESGTHLTASVAEANDAAEFSANDNTSGAWIISKDTFDPDGFSTTWSYNNWVDPGGRLCVGLAKDPAAAYSPGFLIDGTRGTNQIRVALQGLTRGDKLEIQHVFNNVETTLTSVAALSSLVDFSTSFEISFSVTAAGYEATIDQGGSTVVGPVTGTWAAGGVTLTEVEDANGEMRVSAYLQGTFQATSTASLDKIGAPRPFNSNCDDFDDGDLGVNNSANGTGFESGTHLTASVAEANDAAEFSANDNTSGAWIIGKDTVDPDGFSTTWSYNEWVSPGGRLCVGLAKDPAAVYSPGFLIDATRGTPQIRVALQGADRGNKLEIQHVFNNVETTLTSVAALNSLVDFSTSFEISFSVTAAGYEATIDQGGSTVVGPVTGTWAAGGVTLTDVEDANGEMRVSAYHQGIFQATSTASLDKIGLCGFAWKFNGPADVGGAPVNFTATCDTSELGNKALVFISLGNGSPSIKVPLSGGKRLFLDFDSILVFWIGLPSPVRQVTLNNCSGESTVPVAIPASAPVGVSVYFAGYSIDGLGNVPSVTSTKSFVTQ